MTTIAAAITGCGNNRKKTRKKTDELGLQYFPWMENQGVHNALCQLQKLHSQTCRSARPVVLSIERALGSHICKKRDINLITLLFLWRLPSVSLHKFMFYSIHCLKFKSHCEFFFFFSQSRPKHLRANSMAHSYGLFWCNQLNISHMAGLNPNNISWASNVCYFDIFVNRCVGFFLPPAHCGLCPALSCGVKHVPNILTYVSPLF